MKRGFFSESDVTSKRPLPLIAQCGLCGLKDHCLSPKMSISGEGQRKILVVGEAPGEKEDKLGRAFVGPSGELLRDTLRKFGIDFRQDCWITNAVICRPKDNELPTKAIEYCRPNLINAVKSLNPEAILLLGGSAIESLVGWMWKEKVGGVDRWVGWQIPNQKLNAWVMPTYHPSFVMRCENERQAVPRIFFEKHIEALANKTGRPFVTVPDYRNEVEIVFDTDRAASILLRMISKGGTVSFDYETNTLKPDIGKASILCCAVSWQGKKTIAYPWQGKAVGATKELLKSDLLKISHNLKFEHRWTKTILGCEVRNWLWDSMIAAHVLDNREGITGLKFQSFVLLGQESYDDKLEKFRKGVPGGINRLSDKSKVSVEELLRYCGMDALLTYKIAQIQMKQIGG